MESLPPLKPVTELPSGIGWRVCKVEQAISGVDWWVQGGDYVYVLWNTILSCADLDLHDLWLPNLSFGYQPLPVGRRYGTAEYLPSNGIREFQPTGPGAVACGETAWQGMMGRSDTRNNLSYIYEDSTSVFWSGPMAGCLLLHSTRFVAGSADGIDVLSSVLLIPDETDHATRAPQKILNVSERGRVGTEADVLITGFVVSGESARTVLVRAIGPGLTEFGVTDPLEDPVLNVFRNGVEEPVGTNDNWRDSDNWQVIEELSQRAGAFPLKGFNPDAAILFSWLEPGAYTVHVSGKEGSSGVALAEVYQIGD
jgi:hypothetical protein